MQTMKPYERYLAPAGRILMGLFFLMAGIGKIADISGTAGYIESAGFSMGVVLATLTIIVEVGGGLMLITGFYGKYAALALAAFVLFVSFPFHGPSMWAENPMQQIMFMKNIAIAGALLFMAAHIGRAAVTPEVVAQKPTPTL